ncbi:MAG TPA: Gfo/Idh/MocA family oxidoreductase [Thermomicrobiales bacterium]|jgi:predicted dehydrogenase|nr:Gfo/Idh/MocA family oxidoreductase [Thermomicrobiales bacterium]
MSSFFPRRSRPRPESTSSERPAVSSAASDARRKLPDLPSFEDQWGGIPEAGRVAATPGPRLVPTQDELVRQGLAGIRPDEADDREIDSPSESRLRIVESDPVERIPDVQRPGTLDRPLRVGVIGVGYGGSVHIPALMHLPEAEVLAVCARTTARAIAVAASRQIPLVTTDFRQVINETSIDAVVIAAPPYLHHQMVIAALEAGKHVLCESPMGRSLAESRDMAKMADSASVTAMVNHHLRYDPLRSRIRELIMGGYIGVPQAITVNIVRSTFPDAYARPYGWRSQLERGGGALGAIGTQEIDVLRWWLGEIDSVAGTAATMVERHVHPAGSGMMRADADDNFACVLRFASGMIGTVHVTTTAGVESGEEIMISGSEGMLIAQNGGVLLGAKRGEAEMSHIEVATPEDDALPPETHPTMHGTYRLLRRWVEAIREGEPTPSPSFHDGAKAQEIVDGIRRSGQQARWIDTAGRRFQTAIPRHVSV